MADTTPLPGDELGATRRLARTRDGRWFGGVCAGLARYFDLSPVIYRIAFVALALAGGTGVLIYFAAWLVIPDEGDEQSIAEQALNRHRDRPGLWIGVGVVALAAVVLLSHATFWPHAGSFWLAAVLVGGGLVWWELRGREPELGTEAPGVAPTTASTAETHRRRPSLFLPVLGVLLAAGGVAGVLEATGVWSVDWGIAIGAAVAVVGIAIVVGALTGRRVAGLVGLGLLLVPALVLTLAVNVPLRGGVGDKVEHPTSVAALHDHYRLALGTLSLDLTDLQLSSAPTSVRATVGMGELDVVVPAGVTVAAHGSAQVGDVMLFGEDTSGIDVERRQLVGEPPPQLVLDLDVGLGQVKVRSE